MYVPRRFDGKVCIASFVEMSTERSPATGLADTLLLLHSWTCGGTFPQNGWHSKTCVSNLPLASQQWWEGVVSWGSWKGCFLLQEACAPTTMRSRWHTPCCGRALMKEGIWKSPGVSWNPSCVSPSARPLPSIATPHPSNLPSGQRLWLLLTSGQDKAPLSDSKLLFKVMLLVCKY